MDFTCSDVTLWQDALNSYETHIKTLIKPNLISLDNFYRTELPNLLHQRAPSPYITTPELSKLMQWKLTRGKWRPRLLNFVSSLNDDAVRAASQKAFGFLPDVSKAVSEMVVLKGVGPATASAVLAAYAPDIAPFMSDEAMVAAIGHSKDYSLKQYLVFVEKMQTKAKELSTDGNTFKPSDVEQALWSSSVAANFKILSTNSCDVQLEKRSRRKRKR
ncbi:uncharacterized protein LOC111390126 [Olea europaea var. sylvestris]|uniref:uncharacterized protein LOC111390126 n=1 Tax=Olea europaea var. sylvestris TaxID=158386 RepID=UPI000C1D651F|nr:uncharacterized protein LOC111390126 [Olea europaea var. sylvestris]